MKCDKCDNEAVYEWDTTVFGADPEVTHFSSCRACYSGRAIKGLISNHVTHGYVFPPIPDWTKRDDVALEILVAQIGSKNSLMSAFDWASMSYSIADAFMKRRLE